MTPPDLPPPTPQEEAPTVPTARQVAFWQTVRAVAWSFLGIRRSADYEQDVRRLNPIHVIIAGLLGAALFVLMLVLLVQWVVGSAVAR